jgi:hypothetical protein
MVGIEYRSISPEEMISELEQSIRLHSESKYAYQTGLKDLDFDVDHGQIESLNLNLPLITVDQAEIALCNKAIRPTKLLEQNDTEHQVLAFDHRPIGYSGFMDCVTHSLALTDRGLFEVGRYSAVNLSSQSHHWGWFLHRQLAATDELTTWLGSQELSPDEIIEKVYQAFTQN